MTNVAVAENPLVPTSEVRIQAGLFSKLSTDLQQTLDKWMRTRFTSYMWRPSRMEPRAEFVTAWADGELIGRIGVVTRPVTVGGVKITVDAIAGAIVKDEYQHRGVGDKMMKDAAKILDASTCNFGILMCESKLASYYERYGFRVVPGQPWFEQPDRNGSCAPSKRMQYKPDSGVTMVREKPGHTWPEGELDLCGLPF